MNGVMTRMLPIESHISRLLQAIGNIGNNSQVTPKTIRISWEVTAHWIPLKGSKCYLSQATYSRQIK